MPSPLPAQGESLPPLFGSGIHSVDLTGGVQYLRFAAKTDNGLWGLGAEGEVNWAAYQVGASGYWTFPGLWSTVWFGLEGGGEGAAFGVHATVPAFWYSDARQWYFWSGAGLGLNARFRMGPGAGRWGFRADAGFLNEGSLFLIFSLTAGLGDGMP